MFNAHSERLLFSPQKVRVANISIRRYLGLPKFLQERANDVVGMFKMSLTASCDLADTLETTICRLNVVRPG